MKKRYKRVIVKFGTNLLTRGTTELDLEYLDTLTAQVAKLRQDGVEVIVVSSGAVAAGRAKLGVARLRRDIPFRQVLAAVGQGQLMQAYDALFAKHGIVVAQTLLTRRDLSDRAKLPQRAQHAAGAAALRRRAHRQRERRRGGGRAGREPYRRERYAGGADRQPGGRRPAPANDDDGRPVHRRPGLRPNRDANRARRTHRLDDRELR